MLKFSRGILLRPYVVSFLLIVAATALTLLWHPLHEIHSLSAYMVAIVIIAYYGGLLPSVFGIGLSTLSFAYFIAPPVGFSIGLWEDRFRLASFVVVALLFSFLHNARIKAEKQARSMFQRLKLALEATKIGVWDLSLETGAVWHSATMEEIFARHGERFTRAYEVFIGYVHPEDRDFVHRTVTYSIEHGEEFHIQYRILLPEGELRWVATRGRVFLDAKRHPERLVAATEDMTNRPGAAVAPAASLSPSIPPPPDVALVGRAG